ncbi:biotin-dependent carboxyltransferase family protein (plasmid) [Bosea sp. F3-2]|uniref:5-oxoprolinase subunit C family protein n=1 Tax=Bosea sp. F3-2 TaxID=2599640 RepID=UPI0011F09A88|nr:biotin-dependent carboxyltransferase family protein [Bosea sp. F3-2]QEL27355.1 biotin-dependent carboxyltransferase family protein [Bosea sp. F3-2]
MIEIVQTAALNSVQDLGRFGYRRYGINASGAMDALALAAGNALLGNEPGAAGIEVQLFPFVVRFHVPTRLAVTGAACDATLDGRRLPPWWSVPVNAGQTLTLGFPRLGVRSYVAVTGGIDVPEVLGSRSTYGRLAIGGHEGRNLALGDRLPIRSCEGAPQSSAAGFGAFPPAAFMKLPPHTAARPGDLVLRVIPAAEYEQFTEESLREFWSAAWSVTPQSNRMGYRLSGTNPLMRLEATEMRSHGLVPGVIQVPPSGQPIIQLADGNSSGGYPKLGYVIAADLWRLAQARPGTALRFVRCDVAAAREADRLAAFYLGQLRAMAEAQLRAMAS